MPIYYYTYGGENQPYDSGWTEVIAPDRKSADALFRLYHPDKVSGAMNCADIYTEERFRCMLSSGVRDVQGKRREIISSSIELCR